MMKYCFFIITLLSNIIGYSQINEDKYVPYYVGYKFNDGLYLDYQDFLNNSPIRFESIVKPDFENKDFFALLKNSKTISYFDSFGILNEKETKNIWGYSYNGKPHIFWAERFNLIPYIGKVSHFIAKIRVFYDYHHRSFIDPYYYYYGNPSIRYTDEVRQFLIDFETGYVLDFNIDNVKYILQRDTELLNEFENMRRRRQNKFLFYYIKQYNERNPLYLPSQ